VYRKDCVCPAGWGAQVTRALPDYSGFLRKATQFEKLGINAKARRNGFPAHAPLALRVNKSGEAKFPAIWGRHKELIAAMSHRKCVYCEWPINAPRAAHVEHFKPKALFPSLAYEWTNYFLGCPGCNGAKSDKWPKHGGYLRPDEGDPSSHFEFAEDGTVKAVRPGGAAERMLEDFDLERVWLSDERKLHIEEMLRLLSDAVRFYREGNEAQAVVLGATILRNVSDPKRAYSTALTQCFWRAWKSGCPSGKL
jgi:uncharacterized protein (TIGR02646 family)